MTPSRDAAMAAVWPGIVLLSRWRSRTVVRLVLPRAANNREKNLMTHLHALLHGMPSLGGVGQAVGGGDIVSVAFDISAKSEALDMKSDIATSRSRQSREIDAYLQAVNMHVRRPCALLGCVMRCAHGCQCRRRAAACRTVGHASPAGLGLHFTVASLRSQAGKGRAVVTGLACVRPADVFLQFDRQGLD